GGSYYVESLTDRFEHEIRREMKRVDEWGGIEHAVATGKIQASVSEQAYKREMGIQQGEVPKVGVNIFTREEEEKPVDFHPYNKDAADRKTEGLKEIKLNRNNEKVDHLLRAIKSDAEQNKNLMPSIVQAVKEYATVGEIIRTLKEVYGEFEEPIMF
ncbi:MAG TPA: methylmalonyl-CoA mutase, partial [Flavobacteriales bacterium]|nr:methylmalonyl-CoA mutase [Flavobacteriales bacterium]